MTGITFMGVSIFSSHVGAAPKTKVVNAPAYFEATPSGASYQLPNSGTTMLLETPPLPGGDYLAQASLAGFVPTSSDTDDYVDCFINTLEKNDGHYAWGYDGDLSLDISDAFTNVHAGQRLQLWCFQNENAAGGEIYYGTLSVTRYSSISTSG